MMRRCGYCRSHGHRANTCKVVENQITSIRIHQFAERRAFHQLLLANGLGVGAIVQAPNGDTGVIRTMKPHFESYNNGFLEYRPVKYAKSVRSYLKSVTGINHHAHIDYSTDLVRFDVTNHFYTVFSPLDNLADTLYSTVVIAALPHPPENNIYKDQTDGYFHPGRSVKILSPSDETDIDDSFFMTEFPLHERLGKDDRGYGKRVKPIDPRNP